MWTKECPNCAEEIKTKAKVCIHCGKDVNPPIMTKTMKKLIVVAIAMALTAWIMWPLDEEKKLFETTNKTHKSFTD